MSAQHLFLIFIIFSILGWVIDTSYRSLTARKYSSETNWLFNPAYGAGAIILSLVYSYTPFYIPIKILLGGLLLTPVEFAFGAFYLKVKGKRFWDYTKNKWNYKGHVDALHSFYWIVLALVYYCLGLKYTLFVQR